MTPASVVVHVAEELRLFLRARDHENPARVAYDGTSSLGHVVQSLGVPLTEVGTLIVNGVEAEPAHRPAAGSTVTVRPARRPQAAPTDPPRFLLDVHLGTLARRLRLLGVDAAYRNDTDDDELLEESNARARVLLTQDRGLLRRRALRDGAYVRGSRPDDQLLDVLDRFALPIEPFTRCTACGGRLAHVDKAEVADELEPGTRRTYDAFARCQACQRVYWQGAHASRLQSYVEHARHGGQARATPS